MAVRARERGRDTPMHGCTLRGGDMKYFYGDHEGFAIAVGVAHGQCSRYHSVVWGWYGRSVCCVMAEVVGVVHHDTERGYCVGHCQATCASMCREALT